ncbi:hypothetical protein [Thaumasiovibrio subtropicus]|uniref:hypothetical protein n=1 Tax=Thaumasiovibrio subtropicus TaxID=1891207 RepID=UPI000B3580FF|nr:hypothetical protein [Thaumasiovibrio subtropicus]
MSTKIAFDHLQPQFEVQPFLEQHQPLIEKLATLTGILDELSPERIEQEKDKLNIAIENASGYTKKIIEHATMLHGEFVDMVSTMAAGNQISKKGLSYYFIQGWYHTSYTTRFEHMFTERLNNGELDTLDSHQNKFAKLTEHNIDEEEGHELWALQDIVFLGEFDTIDPLTQVFPETKAIVSTQHDRLTRLPFVGFLGYSFYLELLIATQSYGLLGAINGVLGTKPEDHKFIYYHYLVDQGHAVDNIELFDQMVTTEADFVEVIDNMNLIHNMYFGLTKKSFEMGN